MAGDWALRKDKDLTGRPCRSLTGKRAVTRCCSEGLLLIKIVAGRRICKL